MILCKLVCVLAALVAVTCACAGEEQGNSLFDEVNFGDEFDDLDSTPLISGYFQSTFDYLYEQEQVGNARQRLWFEIEREWQEGVLQFNAVTSLDWNPSIGAREEAEETSVRLRLLNMVYGPEQGRLTLGRQMMIWGAGTALSGGTYFNFVDMDDPFVSARAINFLASDAVRWQSYFGDSVLDLIVVPQMPLAALAEKGSAWDTLDLHLRPLLVEAEDQHKTVGGARFSTTVQGMDYSLGFYNGVAHTPSLELVEGQLQPSNPRYTSIYLQASLVARGGLVRAEYTRDIDRLHGIGDGRPVTTDIDVLMLGWEGYLKEVSLRGEWSGIYIRNRGRVDHKVAFSAFYEWQSGDWSIELGTVANLSDESSMVELILARKITDRWQVSTSGRSFSGNETSDYGSLRKLSSFSLELTFYL